MSNNEREEINSKLNIIDIVSTHLTLKRAGARYVGLCPFHNEKTPSFTVTPEKNLFYCYGCHKGGTIFDFVMEMENMDFPQALKFLADKAGVELGGRHKEDSGDRKIRDALKELYRRVSGSFQYILINKPEAETARDYLVKRGLTLELIEEFQIGWAPDDRNWLLKFLKSKGYSNEFLTESGLFSQRGLSYPLFSGRVMFPIMNNNGEVIAFSGRTLKDFGPKYINSPETILFLKKNNLYGLNNSIKKIRETGYFILCEGQMDVIAYHQAGITNAVAPLGTAFTSGQVRILKRYADKAVISFDGDQPGQNAARKAVMLFEQHEITSKIVKLPAEEDPSDILVNKGEKALHKVLKSTINSFDYILENAINLSDISTPEGKEEILRSMNDYLGSLTSEVRRNSCMNEIAERLGVKFNSVERDFMRGGRQPEKEKPGENKIQKKKDVSVELFLMIAVVVNRNSYEFVRGRISIDDLKDARAREIYIALEESFRNEETYLDSVLSRIEDQQLVSLIAEKVTSDEFSINSDELIKDTVKKIKKSSLLKKREEIVKKLKNISKDSVEDVNEIDLLSEKIFLDQEIEKLRLGI
ncbi:MAG: DNA primase [Spirochaetales bacterium]|nr:DNA primase [Spirochaetales bacterium]